MRKSISAQDDIYSDEASDDAIVVARSGSESSLSELATSPARQEEEEEEEDEEEDDDEEIEEEDELDESVDDIESEEEFEPDEEPEPAPVKPRFKIKLAPKATPVETTTTADDDDDLDDDESDFSDDSESAPKAMTQRQKAKAAGESAALLELSMDPGKRKIFTEEEMQLRKSETARKRKNQAEQRLEDQKTDTINRLLKKQATRRTAKDNEDEIASNAPEAPLNQIHYQARGDQSLLSFPADYVLLQVQASPEPKSRSTCEATSCSKPMIYRSPKTGKAACSMQHLKSVEV